MLFGKITLSFYLPETTTTSSLCSIFRTNTKDTNKYVHTFYQT